MLIGISAALLYRLHDAARLCHRPARDVAQGHTSAAMSIENSLALSNEVHWRRSDLRYSTSATGRLNTDRRRRSTVSRSTK
jgi:hypothetical protein